MTTETKENPNKLSRLTRSSYVAMAAFALATGIAGYVFGKPSFLAPVCVFFGLIGLIGNLIMAAKEDRDNK